MRRECEKFNSSLLVQRGQVGKTGKIRGQSRGGGRAGVSGIAQQASATVAIGTAMVAIVVSVSAVRLLAGGGRHPKSQRERTLVVIGRGSMSIR